MRGEGPDKEVGFCGNQLPQVATTEHDAAGNRDSIRVAEYGQIGLSHSKLESVHCGLSNLKPHLVVSRSNQVNALIT